MRILVCNDDGIYSPGIATLAEVASSYGTVRIVAPHVEQSSMGHAITANRPFRIAGRRLADSRPTASTARPADCVALGSHHWERVDVVLSGCNLGFNIGNGIWHSGTLSAAKQAVMLRVAGHRLQRARRPRGFCRSETVDPSRARRALARTGLPLVNVNVPRSPRGLIWTRVRCSIRRRDRADQGSYGRELYWFSVRPWKTRKRAPTGGRWSNTGCR